MLNGSSFIESAIRSVLEQSYTPTEYIVIDGGSTDATLDIVRGHGDRIDRIISEPDGGIYDAMNKGIRLAQGQLIGILNSDDWYESHAVDSAVRAWRANPGAGIIHGRMAVHDADDAFVTDVGHRDWPLLRLLATPFKHPAMFVTAETYASIGLYDATFTIAGDYDFMLRSRRRRVAAVHLPRVLTHVRRVGATTGLTGVAAPEEVTAVLTRHTGRAKLARLLVRARHWRLRVR